MSIDPSKKSLVGQDDGDNSASLLPAPALRLASLHSLEGFEFLGGRRRSSGGGSSSGKTGTTSSSSTGSASSTSAGSTTAPAWISSLYTASIAADMQAADIAGTVGEAGLTKLLSDLDSTLSATRSTLTAKEFADLNTIAANLNNGLSTSAYLTYVFDALVKGNAANATWTGGGATSVSLGNLAAGSNATKLAELTGEWLQGTDLPSSNVTMSGYAPFSVSSSVVGNALFGASGPAMSDINQGYLGDCYFLSSCAEIAHQNASAIDSMFTDNGNGTYGVRLYVDGAAEYVTVNASLADGGSIFNNATDIWASLAEKAYAQFQAGGIDTGNSVNYGDSYSTIGNGGQPAYALEALTGASALDEFFANGGSWADYGLNASLNVAAYSSGVSTANLLNTIAADLAAHDDVILSSYTNATDSYGRTTLVADHAMSVYGYDSATRNLEIRNPWGTEGGQNWDTTFEVSLNTLLNDGDIITTDNAGSTAGSTKSIVASGLNNQTFIFAPNFGQETLYGFQATGAGADVLQFDASAFGAGLTAANQTADWQALISSGLSQNAAGSAMITDIHGDRLTLNGVSMNTLANSATAGAFKFV